MGSGPDPEGPGIWVTCPKITCKELNWPWKFSWDPTTGSKVISLSSGHSRKLQTLQIFYHFTSWRINAVYSIQMEILLYLMGCWRILFLNANFIKCQLFCRQLFVKNDQVIATTTITEQLCLSRMRKSVHLNLPQDAQKWFWNWSDINESTKLQVNC